MSSSARDLEGARHFQEQLDEDEVFQMAVTKLVNTMAGTNDDLDVGVLEATWIALDEFEAQAERLEELEAENEELRERVSKLEGDVAQSKSSTTSSQTKVGLAMEVAMDEAVRRCSKGIRGGSVDYRAVRDIADREHGTDLNSGTVYDAFDRLADDWAAFHVKEGQDGPNTDNKQLRCNKEAISPALEEAVSSGGN